MRKLRTDIPDVLIIEPRVFEDARGYFYESYNQRLFTEITGVSVEFVQDNHSLSRRNVLRGLHYQCRRPQGKLVRVVHGAVFDVAVDIRRSSPTFGRWVGVELSEANKRMLWIPPGFAHGFVATGEISLEQMVSLDKVETIHKAIIKFSESDALLPVKEFLGDDYSYSEIRAVKASL